jgi:hypothetical protein
VNRANPNVVFNTTGEYLNTIQLIIATNIIEIIPAATIKFVSIEIIFSTIRYNLKFSKKIWNKI